MLPPAHRLRRSEDFSSVLRRGSRRGGPRLVVHHLDQLADHGSPSGSVDSGRVGLVVSRSVGGSVVRHRVSRRLRAQLALRLPLLGPGSATVVRALPAAANATSAQLGADLERALSRIGSRR